MGLFDNGFRLGTGVAIGLGAIVLAPTVIPLVGTIAKPLVKATIKSGLILYGKGREMIAETTEVLEDLTAEAQAELSREREEAVPPIAPEQGTA